MNKVLFKKKKIIIIMIIVIIGIIAFFRECFAFFDIIFRFKDE